MEHFPPQRPNHLTENSSINAVTKQQHLTAHKILTPEQASFVTKSLKSQGQQVVLVSGCFDLLHIGHLSLMEGAKYPGDILAVTTPSDEDIRNNKNPNRPIVGLADRLRILSSLEVVDFVFPQVSWLMMDVLSMIQPSVYAVWSRDEHMISRLNQAERYGIKLREVNTNTYGISTTNLISILINKLD